MMVASAAPPLSIPMAPTNTRSRITLTIAAMAMNRNGLVESPMPRSTAETVL